MQFLNKLISSVDIFLKTRTKWKKDVTAQDMKT